jgi:hypothetical protein
VTQSKNASQISVCDVSEQDKDSWILGPMYVGCSLEKARLNLHVCEKKIVRPKNGTGK